MIFLIACVSSSNEIDSAQELESIQPPFHEWEHEISLVYNGSLIHNNHIIKTTTAPAGINQPVELSFVISNLSDTEQTFSGSWLTHENEISWLEPPPTVLPPQESTSFSLFFTPLSCQTEQTIYNTLSIPEKDFSVSIEITCPPPLRLVLIGDDGYTLISDDYGTTFGEIESNTDLPLPLRAQSLAWGDGIFFRAFARGTTPDALGLYQYSSDGENWEMSQDTPDYAPSDCTYGMGRFVCVRADSLSWSIDGRSVTHEPALGDFRLNQIIFRDNAFVAVGRGARRVRSEDAQTWTEESFGIDPDTYHSLVQSDDILVAGGGINRYFLSYSTDNGLSWQDSPYGGCTGNYIQSLAYHNELFLAQGASSCHHNMHRSTDGINWEPIVELTPFDRFVLLGGINGYFIAQSTDNDGTHIYRSSNGYDWDKRHTLSPTKNIRLMTQEEWNP